MGVRVKWRSEDFNSYVEIVPIGDAKEHLAGDECWCNPITETIGRPLIHHNVFDNCYSYNKGVGELREVVLQRPDWLPDGERLNGVPVDACIADVVQHLWDNGIHTLGSCCEHGKANPSLVLSQSEDNYELIQSLIAEKDSRSWSLKQWQLVDVSVDETPTNSLNT